MLINNDKKKQCLSRIRVYVLLVSQVRSWSSHGHGLTHRHAAKKENKVHDFYTVRSAEIILNKNELINKKIKNKIKNARALST